MRNLETCFSPALYEADRHHDSIVVILDLLRATTSICAAFENGVKSIIPVASVEEAKAYKERGYLVAAEKDGYILDFADFGNSPFNFKREVVEGRTIVYRTTNGTGIIKMAKGAYAVAVGAFINFSALIEWIVSQEHDVLLFCAGWKNRFNLEDSILAGAIAKSLLDSGMYTTICDSTFGAIDLWGLAKDDPWGYLQKAAQRSRLRDKGLDDCIQFCLSCDVTRKVPMAVDGVLV